ncbi:MAG: heme exporter protein CcmD [Gammaproteobacteria bacterium]|nr:heme exporter protein CcmD [Gammaproteobacteria bacterium]MBV9621459.1 heme exporter protein CcmD [Gammaproteobacteria bacterium]
MREFLDMGGYAAYVWPSYVVTIGVIVVNVIWARRSLARARQLVRRRAAGEAS